MFRKIVVPLDGSTLAERALPSAEHLARLTGVPLHLVRVVGAPPTWAAGVAYAPAVLSGEMIEQEAQAATAYLETVRTRVLAAGGEARIAAPMGDASVTLLDYESVMGIDLVV